MTVWDAMERINLGVAEVADYQEVAAYEKAKRREEHRKFWLGLGVIVAIIATLAML